MSFDRDGALEKLLRSPDRVERLIEDHPNDVLKQPGDAGDWGAVDIMAFLRDWDAVVEERLDRILTESDPEFEDDDPDLWSIERDYHAEDPPQVLTEFRAARQKLVARLSQLDDAAWQRTGYMQDGTQITVEDLVSQLLANDHQQLTRLKELLL